MDNIKKEIKGLVEFIRDEVRNAGKTGCVVGVSGGIDSAVILALCKLAFPDNTFGVSMPYGKKESTVRAREICTKYSIQLLETHIEDIVLVAPMTMLCNHNPLSIGNFMARTRMTILYSVASNTNSLVIGTDNLTENYIGYFTKYGDGGVDINPIGEYYKYEVYELAKELGVPQSIIDAKPSAELWEGQTDEGELKISYANMDRLIPIAMEFERFIVNQTATPKKVGLPFDRIVEMFDETLKTYHSDEEIKIVNTLIHMHHNTEHKRIIPKEYHR